MKQNEILAYLYDFISMLLEQKIVKDNIDQVILFGSVARDDFDEQSDIDLFVEIKDLSKRDAIEQKIKETINIFEIKSDTTWKLRKISLPIKAIIGKLKEPSWSSLHKEIISSGIVAYGSYKEVPKDLQHYALVSYSINKISQNKKMRFLRKIYGCRTKKKDKIYTQQGMLSSLGGEKIGTNQMLLKGNDFKKILDLIKDFKVPYKIKEIWA